jgi:hypothetical protein
VGANIDYYLADEPVGEVTLAILDASGNLVREYSSEATDNPTPAGIAVEQWNLARVGTPELVKTAGMHRFLWDLRYPGPWDSNRERSGQSGPRVPPGKYQARLTVGDWSNIVSFQALMDPRVTKEGFTEADAADQIELALKVRDALSNARLAAAKVEKALEERSSDPTLAEVKKELITAARRYSQPMLVDQLLYLYSNLNRADQRPGRDAINRYEELNEKLQEQVRKLEQALRTTDGEDR